MITLWTLLKDVLNDALTPNFLFSPAHLAWNTGLGDAGLQGTASVVTYKH